MPTMLTVTVHAIRINGPEMFERPVAVPDMSWVPLCISSERLPVKCRVVDSGVGTVGLNVASTVPRCECRVVARGADTVVLSVVSNVLPCVERTFSCLWP